MINKKYLKEIFYFLEMLAGTTLNAAAFGLIIVPLGFAAGGITGLSRVLTRVLPLPLSSLVFVLNMLLLVVGLVFVGREFVAKTVTVSFIFPLMLEVFSRWSLGELLADTMLCTILAGALLGVGTGLVLRSGASCGGFDVFGVILNRRFGLPVARVMNICDTTVIALQALGQPLLPTVYGILVIAVVTVCVSWMVNLGTGESQVLVFSEQHDAIRHALIYRLDVGVTSLLAESGYKERDMKVIVSIMPYRKVAEMKKLIMEIDPAAFVVVDQIHSVLGRGYTVDRYFQVNRQK